MPKPISSSSAQPTHPTQSTNKTHQHTYKSPLLPNTPVRGTTGASPIDVTVTTGTGRSYGSTPSSVLQDAKKPSNSGRSAQKNSKQLDDSDPQQTSLTSISFASDSDRPQYQSTDPILNESTESNSEHYPPVNTIINIPDDGNKVRASNADEFAPPVESKCTTIWDWSGGIITFGAMVPQGFFGGLLAAKVCREGHVGNLGGAITSVVVTLCAGGGKYALVRYFNTPAFKEFANFNWRNLNPKNWSLSGVINGVFTIVASGVFAGLAKMSLDGVGNLLLEYETATTDKIAQGAFNKYVQDFFMGSAFWANCVGFPGIHHGAAALINQGAHYVIENPEFRRDKDEMCRKIEGVRLQWKDAVEEVIAAKEESKQERLAELNVIWRKVLNSNNFVSAAVPDLKLPNSAKELKKIFHTLEKLATEIPAATPYTSADFIVVHETDKKTTAVDYLTHSAPILDESDDLFAMRNLRERFLDLSSPDETPEAQSWCEFFTKHAISTGLTGVGVWGLYNFLKMTMDSSEIFHVTHEAPVLKWMDYSSMSGLAFSAIYRMASNMVDGVFRRDLPINLFSACKRFGLGALTFFVCAFGGTPNSYQSYIANEDLTMMIMAATASLLIECYGFHSLFTGKVNDRIMAKDLLMKIVMLVDQLFRAAANVDGIKPSELHRLQNRAPLSPASLFSSPTTAMPSLPTTAKNNTKQPIDVKQSEQAAASSKLIAESKDEAKPKPMHQPYRPSVQWLCEKVSCVRSYFFPPVRETAHLERDIPSAESPPAEIIFSPVPSPFATPK